MQRYFLGFLLLLLPACASIPLTSLPKLVGLKFETVDMSKIELAVRLQETVGIKDGTATLEFNLENPDFEHVMVLGEPSTSLTPYLKRQEKEGYKIYGFKISEEQADLAEAFRTKALKAKEISGGKTTMKLNAKVGFCQLAEGPVLEKIKMTFYLKTANDSDFYKLIKEQNLVFTEEDVAEMEADPIYCSDA